MATVWRQLTGGGSRASVQRLRMGTGYVLNGGGICMELLTPQEWSPATSISALVMSVRAMLLVGQARLKSTEKGTKEPDYCVEECAAAHDRARAPVLAGPMRAVPMRAVGAAGRRGCRGCTVGPVRACARALSRTMPHRAGRDARALPGRGATLRTLSRSTRSVAGRRTRCSRMREPDVGEACGQRARAAARKRPEATSDASGVLARSARSAARLVRS
jgi:hypothetical protein